MSFFPHTVLRLSQRLQHFQYFQQLWRCPWMLMDQRVGQLDEDLGVVDDDLGVVDDDLGVVDDD